MINFAIVGTGWRCDHYLRIAAACPDKFHVAGIVTRDKGRTAVAYARWRVPLYESLAELLSATQPHFIVTSVPWKANPAVLQSLAEAGVPALSETPPATTVAEMASLCQLVAGGARIQVAEQFWAQPHHAARLALVETGQLGAIVQAQISVAHGYHGISLMRRFLGIGFENATISGQRFSSRILQGPGRDGPPLEAQVVESKQSIATFDFGDRTGILDFSGDQYFSYIRGQRVLVRGERGELVDQTAVYLQNPTTPIHLAFHRINAGQNGNHEGNYLKGIQAGESWLYHNPLAPATLSDEEIAIATCLLRMAEYAVGGPDFYSLAEACQDRYLDIKMEEALSRGEPVTTETQVWAN